MSLDTLHIGYCMNRCLCSILPPMRRIFAVEAKKKLWRPCREARALGL